MTHPTRTRPRRRAAAVGAACLLLSLTGCGSSGGGSSATPSSGGTGGAATAHVVIKNFLFDPAALTVAPGAVVTVSNEDQTAHTLTAGTKVFDTGTIDGGKTVTFTAPSAAGAYAFNCTIHPFMKGTLTVR